MSAALKVWARDLGMGVRFAVAGGREGWVRTILTAIGVGLGVALLIVTTSVPNALAARDARGDARTDIMFSGNPIPKTDATLVVGHADTTFHGKEIRGRIYQPDGPNTPVVPGISAYPKPGEMVVSPGLRKLLDSDDGKLLRERLDTKVVGTIGDEGLIGPGELIYYKGSDSLVAGNYPVERIDKFGTQFPSERMDPILILLTLIIFIVLLMPVGVFIAAAVRFGGERRDRRLAALRLIGADGRTVRRVAAGEAFAGSLFGLVLGTGFFLAARQLAAGIEVERVSVFPQDLDPSPLLVLLVALVVPAAAVAVTLFSLRGVVIEPLGVVRTAKPSRRRLWWRLLLPLIGLGMLYPMVGQGNNNGNFNQYMVTGGVVLLLVGITALLPWLIERTVTRLNGGGVAWQLAVRRMQLSSATAARMVNGIAVAVAGAIALQMLFAGVEGDYTKETGNDVARAQMSVNVPSGPDAARQTAEVEQLLRETPGVKGVQAFTMTSFGDNAKEPENFSEAQVGTCAALRTIADLPSCKDGDVFVVTGAQYEVTATKFVKPGKRLYVDAGAPRSAGKPVSWKVPADLKEAGSRTTPEGFESTGVLFTPSAFPAEARAMQRGLAYIQLDESVPDAVELARNAAVKAGPLVSANEMVSSMQKGRFKSIQTGLFVGATCVLVLIGASLLVSQLEQLRERKKLLSALVAFGTRRRTLSLSVFWQTAVPIALGLLLAGVVGLTLGAVLLLMVGRSVSVDWASVVGMTGVGAGVVLAVTVLSLPPLLRLMRPEGLRTE
ncbi:ABC transporter permease [Streptomyces sp. T-3]|nr:ABC transporter permease [Streptomyces sp. T-3]